ncbi:MAG: hypothetical protein CL678_18630 [Bdellovibrionaceae bacterium]|nr:hypothetical protein [Pseudobdellovibrionaceae bacterium]|tara:strand:+ start:238 stop:843 length:606 start_codon:yes stop_codon:yes gene_type:complete
MLLKNTKMPILKLIILNLIIFTMDACHLFEEKPSTKETKPLESCVFPTQNGLEKIDRCVSKINHSYQLTAPALKQIKFNSNGLSTGYLGKNCFWAHLSGKVIQSHCYDNGPDYFKEGLARYINSNQQFGFINSSLEVVIKAQYDFAFPFQHGKSKVCTGCKRVQSKKGTHSSFSGGEWKIIDKKGKVITHCKKAKNSSECN